MTRALEAIAIELNQRDWFLLRFPEHKPVRQCFDASMLRDVVQ